MVAFARSSNRAASAALITALATLAACTEELPPIEGTTSLRVELVSPSDPGSPESRLDSTDRNVELRLTALDAQGEVDTGFSGTADVYVHYLGSLTPELGDSPLATATLTAGASPVVELELPLVYGPAFLWVEHTGGDQPTYATGTSPTLWYRDPFLVDVSQPPDEMALDALERSPLEEKQVSVSSSQYGARGRLVVTGAYAQGYTLADVDCAGGTPCSTGPYDSIFVFTFSRPEDEDGRRIQRGQIIDRVAGSVSEFNGLTEVNFPQSFTSDPTLQPERVPDPVVIQSSWLSSRIEMERVEAALVAVEDGVLCPLDDDFDTFSQWKLDVGRGCDDPVNVISKGEVTDFDPAAHVGETIPRVVGTLRPVNIGSFDVWIIFPRDIGDITGP